MTHTLRITIQTEGQEPLGLALKFDDRDLATADGMRGIADNAWRMLRSAFTSLAYRLEGVPFLKDGTPKPHEEWTEADHVMCDAAREKFKPLIRPELGR